MWVFIPAHRQPLNVLTSACLVTLGAQLCLQHYKEFFNNSRPAQSVSDEVDCGGIWNAVQHTKPDKLLKGASVILLGFELVNRKWMAAPTLSLKSSWRTRILKRIRGSILLCPAFLLYS